MKRKRALLKYDDAPPSETGLEVEVYLADEVDAVIKRQAAAAKMGMDAAMAISTNDLQRAHKLNRESSPEALESERSANAILTEENRQLQNEVADLRAFIDGMKRHIEAAAAMYGLKRS